MKKILLSIILISLLIIGKGLVVSANTISANSGPAHFEVNALVEHNDLCAGVVHEKYTAYVSNTLTGFNAAGSGGGGTNISGQLYPQSVNFLSIPQGSNARIVNWAMSGPYFSSWKKGTVESMALDFESQNPGWKVIAAINADFFDISGHQPLMQAPSGSCMVNGELYKATSRTSVGFTNKSEGATLVGNQSITFSEQLYLCFYDEDGVLKGEFASAAINPEVPNEELSIYHSYYYFPEGMTYEDNIREYFTCSLPVNGFVVSGNKVQQEVCYSTSSYYGSGICEENLSSSALIQPGTFGFYTTNEQINSLAKEYPNITIGRKVVGAYAECDNISGCGDTLVYNGEGCILNNKERHPRTIVGVKADGTVVLCTVDGRQPNNDMYGMTLDELSATLLAYGCVEGYNLDGGGSTTMIIRDGKKFRTLNSPSDGSPRNDANALLVVVQDIDLGIEEITDTTCTLKAPTSIKGTQIDNIVVHMDGRDFNLVDKVTINQLKAHQSYKIEYEYDRTYHGVLTHVTGEAFSIQTGYKIPQLKSFIINKSESLVDVHLELDDPDGVVDEIRLYYTKGSKVVVGNSITLDNNGLRDEDYSIVVFYTLDSTTKYSDVLEFKNPTIQEVSPEKEVKKGCFNKSGMIVGIIMSLSLIYLCIKRNKNQH